MQEYYIYVFSNIHGNVCRIWIKKVKPKLHHVILTWNGSSRQTVHYIQKHSYISNYLCINPTEQVSTIK